MVNNRIPANQDYIHMKVSDILMLCMEDSSVIPVQQLVESLVMIGPDSLSFLQQVLDEASKRNVQVLNDQKQVLSGLIKNLASLGMKLPAAITADGVIRMRSERFYVLMKKQGITEEPVQIECMQLLQDSRDLLISLSIKLDLLTRITQYLEDWTMGLLYLSTRYHKQNPEHLH